MNKLALWCKRKEIEALEKSRVDNGIVGYQDYWGGKAEGFANVWEHIVFSGRKPHPLEYNRENNRYSEAISEAVAAESEVDGFVSVDELEVCPIHDFDMPCPSCALVRLHVG